MRTDDRQTGRRQLVYSTVPWLIEHNSLQFIQFDVQSSIVVNVKERILLHDLLDVVGWQRAEICIGILASKASHVVARWLWSKWFVKAITSLSKAHRAGYLSEHMQHHSAERSITGHPTTIQFHYSKVVNSVLACWFDFLAIVSCHQACHEFNGCFCLANLTEKDFKHQVHFSVFFVVVIIIVSYPCLQAARFEKGSMQDCFWGAHTPPILQRLWCSVVPVTKSICKAMLLLLTLPNHYNPQHSQLNRQ